MKILALAMLFFIVSCGGYKANKSSKSKISESLELCPQEVPQSFKATALNYRANVSLSNLSALSLVSDPAPPTLEPLEPVPKVVKVLNTGILDPSTLPWKVYVSDEFTVEETRIIKTALHDWNVYFRDHFGTVFDINVVPSENIDLPYFDPSVKQTLIFNKYYSDSFDEGSDPSRTFRSLKKRVAGMKTKYWVDNAAVYLNYRTESILTSAGPEAYDFASVIMQAIGHSVGPTVPVSVHPENSIYGPNLEYGEVHHCLQARDLLLLIHLQGAL